MRKPFGTAVAWIVALGLAACGGTPAETALAPEEAKAEQPVPTTGSTSATQAEVNAAPAVQAEAEIVSAPTLTLIGHASLKIKTSEGVVIYIDPYYEGDYSEKADIILVTHDHSDHNEVDLVSRNADCVVLTTAETINPADNSYNTFEYYGVKIEPVSAANQNHPIGKTNGLVLTFDGITVYDASDTSILEQMADLMPRTIDYAFFPIDGKYNMDAAEAAQCAELVGAKHNVPFHYFEADVSTFTPENLLVVAYGETITLSSQ